VSKRHFTSKLACVAASALCFLSFLSTSAQADATNPDLTISASLSSVSTSNSPLPLVQGTVYALTYQLTDNDAAKLLDVGFSDTLPTGLTVAPGSTVEDADCGQTTVGHDIPAKAEPGASTVSESGFNVFPGSDQSCYVEFFVVASTIETGATDTPGSASFQLNLNTQPAQTSTQFIPWTLNVIAPSSFTITAPATGATFNFNQKVPITLSASLASGDSITPGSMYAVDEDGYEVANGQDVPTYIPGTHTLTVWGQTADGFYAPGTKITYTVRSPQPVDVISHPMGSLSFKVEYLAVGTATSVLTYNGTVISSVKHWVWVGKEMPVWMSLNAAGKRLVASHKSGFNATLTITYRVWSYHSFTSHAVNVIPNIHIN
jgi:hypothetical protein